MKRLLKILAGCLALALLLTLFFWVHSWRMPDYIAYTAEDRKIFNADYAYTGSQSFGLYAGEGRIGWLYNSQICNIETAALADPPFTTRLTPHLVWDHSDTPDGGYFGGLASGQLIFFKSDSYPGLTLYNHEESGLSHTMTVRGLLLDARLLTPILACLLALTLWQLRRPAHRRLQGLCPTCSYDLRRHQQGGRCPECGMIIQPIPA